jgi:DNA repair protein RadD
MDVTKWHEAPVPWQLWKHQETGVARLEKHFFERDERALVCYCPTGGGKTIMAIEMLRRAAAKGARSMFLAPRQELIGQVCKKLDTFAPFSYGKIVADKKVPRSTYAELQVASLDTLVSRIVKRKNLILPPIDFVVLDECHLYQTDLRMALIAMFGKDCKFMGLSATPGHHDGRGLAPMFDHIIKVASVRELTEVGVLAPGRYYSPSTIDMNKIKLVRNAKTGSVEYNGKQVAERLEPLLGDIPGTWLDLGPERRTCVFAQNVGQSVFLADCFRKHGVAAEHADGSMDPDLREDVFERYRNGEIQVLVNCDLATYGFDLPEMSHVILACRDRSVIRYLQKIGRAARSSPGKEDFIIQDHAGNWHEHGRHDEERYWGLEGYSPKKRTGRPSGQRAKNITQLACPECDCVFCGSLTCPECGYFFEAAARRFQVIDGQLEQIAKDQERSKEASEMDQKLFFCQAMGFLRARNAKHPDRPWRQGWVNYAFKAKFGKLPPDDWVTMDPMTPNMSMQRWMKHYVIKRAKQWQNEQKSK